MPRRALELCALPAEKLLEQAGRLTLAASGASVNLCAIINIKSGHCGMNCKFCIQGAHNAGFKGYELLSESQLISRIEHLATLPVDHIGLVASGKALSGRDFDRLLSIIENTPPTIRPRLCASLGQLDSRRLKRLKAAGIRRYHHNLETSQNFYSAICTTQAWQSRRDTVASALDAGLEVCSGGIFGLGECWDDRIDLALELGALGVKNIPLNFLHPQPGTPLAQRKPLSADEGLRIIALFRHLLPNAALRVCGGRPITFADRQEEIFAAGANALMTGDYLTTKGFGITDDLFLIKEAGRTVALQGGDGKE